MLSPFTQRISSGLVASRIRTSKQGLRSIRPLCDRKGSPISGSHSTFYGLRHSVAGRFFQARGRKLAKQELPLAFTPIGSIVAYIMPADAPPRVLVLEDEHLIAMDLQEALEQCGYEVVGPVHSCEAALELLWSQKVDAAVLDLIIGQGTCVVVANELNLTGTPWAFASGFDTHELHDLFPGVPVIPKPSPAETVTKVVGSLLETRQG